MSKIAFVVMAASALDKEIKSIGVAGNKLNTRIQIAACNAIHYSIAHGDVGFGQRLVLALNNGQRKNSLVAFLEKFGKFQWNKEEKSLVYRKRDELKAEDATTLVETIDVPWFEVLKAPEVKSMYDFDDGFSRFLKQAKKMAENPDVVFKGGEHMSAMLAYYNQLVAAEAIEKENEESTFTPEELEETAALMQAALAEGDDTNNRQELRAA